MSPIQDIVNLAVQTYFQHYSTPEQSTLLTTDASLGAKSSKDSMVEVLENVRSLIDEEITQRTTHLKRRRNQEHASIFQLPHEVFVQIMVLASSSALNISSTCTLMSVSKYWCDTIAQCPYIWSRIDVAARPHRGNMTILRMLRGPVEVRCKRDPADLNAYLADLATLDPTRLQALVWHRSRRTEPLRSFLRERNSSIVDLAVEVVDGDTWRSTTHRLDLSPEGPCLRHVDLCRTALPWTSPRLSRLQTLTLRSLDQGEAPSVNDLYRILSSSPTLRRIQVQHLADAGQEDHAPHAIKEPVFLPVLRSIKIVQVPSIIPNTLIPLIRAPSCRYLEVHPKSWASLEPSDAILDLIGGPIASQFILTLTVGGDKDGFSVFLTSNPKFKRYVWGDWDNPDTGISIRLFPSQMGSLRSLFDGLISRLQTAHWKPRALYLALDVSDDALGTQMVLPLLCGFTLAFSTVTRLGLALPSSAAHCSALRLLEDGVPELTSLDMSGNPAISYDREEWANGVKAFLGRRYPLHTQGDLNTPQHLCPLSRIHVPKDVAGCLRRGWPETLLSMEEVLDYGSSNSLTRYGD